MSLITDVMDRLAELGDTEDEVAAALLAKGIKGAPRQECACPIYNFLAGEGFPVNNVDVDVAFFDDPIPGWVDLPAAVSEFIACFDDGAYPDLILAPGVAL